MEWRVPKVKGMLTPRNIVTAAVLILIFSIPFGFLGSHAQFAVFTSFLPLTFMSVSFLGFLLLPFLPGSKVELKQEAIVRPGSRWDDRSAYRDIHCCYYIRECTWAKDKDGPITNVHEGDFEGPAFTSFLVFMKGEPQVTSGCMLSGASRRSIGGFVVPDNVDLDQVLQILRDKGVAVSELTPTSDAVAAMET